VQSQNHKQLITNTLTPKTMGNAWEMKMHIN